MIFIPYIEEDFEIANSYLDVADADDIIGKQRDSATWTGYDATTKEMLLIQSSLAVDGALVYQGVKISDLQVLKFPRMGASEDASEASKVLPANVKYAVAMLCLQYSNNKAFKNITSETISKLSWDFKDGGNDIGAGVIAFLKPLRMTTIKIGVSNEY